MPRSLFGRMVLAIALVALACQVVTIAIVVAFGLWPLGRLATSDLAALMIEAANDWQAAPDDASRRGLARHLADEHGLHLLDAPPGAYADWPAPKVEPVQAARLLPYFHLLESALAERSGTPVPLVHGRDAGGGSWYWAALPAGDGGATLRVGFDAARVAVQPSLALLLVLTVGALVTLAAATAMARWLIGPLQRIVEATQPIGQGRRPAPLPESGPQELAQVARAFNAMAEQVQELLANRTTLLVGVSHDLRSPLARIRLALGMAAERPDPALLERIARDVDAMNELIGRCLEVGRDFSERETAEVDLCRMMAEVAQEHAHQGVQVRGQRRPDCRLRVRPLALRRIVCNLVDNAVRYGGGQPVDVELRVADGVAEVAVLDRGPGIPEGEREAVFRPFHRLEASRSQRTGGSGLGLAIVRQIASANGWTVQLRARPGGGTEACVRLPLEGAAVMSS
ncbi:MAG: HAMP domain-containing protein [Burkholderiaceae bacterium]|nr:HAMP domain-containing protein [Burkholderiaceae bacterium]